MIDTVSNLTPKTNAALQLVGFVMGYRWDVDGGMEMEILHPESPTLYFYDEREARAMRIFRSHSILTNSISFDRMMGKFGVGEEEIKRKIVDHAEARLNMVEIDKSLIEGRNASSAVVLGLLDVFYMDEIAFEETKE
jgi:hypothetical protein